MTGKAAKAYVAACLLVFAVSLCLLVYQGRKGVQAEEASDLSAETTAGQENYLQYDASLEENTLLMQLPEGVTQQDIELQSDCMAEKVTIRFRTGRNNVDIVWLCTDCKHYKMKKTEIYKK